MRLLCAYRVARCLYHWSIYRCGTVGLKWPFLTRANCIFVDGQGNDLQETLGIKKWNICCLGLASSAILRISQAQKCGSAGDRAEDSVFTRCHDHGSRFFRWKIVCRHHAERKGRWEKMPEWFLFKMHSGFQDILCIMHGPKRRQGVVWAPSFTRSVHHHLGEIAKETAKV